MITKVDQFHCSKLVVFSITTDLIQVIVVFVLFRCVEIKDVWIFQTASAIWRLEAPAQIQSPIVVSRRGAKNNNPNTCCCCCCIKPNKANDFEKVLAVRLIPPVGLHIEIRLVAFGRRNYARNEMRRTQVDDEEQSERWSCRPRHDSLMFFGRHHHHHLFANNREISSNDKSALLFVGRQLDDRPE